MSRVASAGASVGPVKPLANTGYFAASEKPLASLIFLLPLIVIYELGKVWPTAVDHQIVAFTLLAKFFSLMGATGRFVPALAVVFALLAIHIARKESWEVDVRYLGWMLVESILLAVPLIGVGVLASKYAPLFGGFFESHMKEAVLLSIGAGIYEELIFRLIAIALLSFILVDLIKLSQVWAAVWIVLISSIAFSLYHYLGPEQFVLRTFVFRTLAGCYFATIFLYRGFGITAGSHAAYDILIVVLRP